MNKNAYAISEASNPGWIQFAILINQVAWAQLVAFHFVISLT